MAVALIDGTFTGTGASEEVDIQGTFNVSLSGFGTATVAIERSFDGSTWRSIESFSSNAERRGFETESGIKYRGNCTSYTSGSIQLRVSQ